MPWHQWRFTWWCHQMEAFSVLLALCAGNSPVTDEFPAQRPVTQSFDVLFDLRLNKRWSKQSGRQWFETVSPSIWRHCNAEGGVHCWTLVRNTVGYYFGDQTVPLLWRHNGPDGVSNHQPHDCLLNRLFGHRSKKTLKLRVTGLCVGNSPETGEFPAQMASNAENASIWWRHHALCHREQRVEIQEW